MVRASSSFVSHPERAQLTKDDYEHLRQAVKVTLPKPKEVRSCCCAPGRVEQPDLSGVEVSMAAFMDRFPAHLHALLRPVFLSFAARRGELGAAPANEAVSASWPGLVAGVSQLTHEHHGSTWADLMDMCGADGSGGAAAAVELAATLCFWCGYPTRSPEDAQLVEALGSVLSPLQQLLAQDSARPLDIAAATKKLTAAARFLPGGVGPRLGMGLLGWAQVEDMPVPDSRILNPGSNLLARSITGQLWSSPSWTPLYRDYLDGRSLVALQKGVLHYEGPALLLIRTGAGEVLGAQCSVWEDGHGGYSESGRDTLLFGLAPCLALCKPSGHGSSHVYMNFSNKYAPRGVGFGGSKEMCRLWLEEDLATVQASEDDATYAAGRLLPSEEFRRSAAVSVVEVWGCGGEHADAAQQAQRQKADEKRDRHRQADGKGEVMEGGLADVLLPQTMAFKEGMQTDMEVIKAEAKGEGEEE